LRERSRSLSKICFGVLIAREEDNIHLDKIEKGASYSFGRVSNG
jgi:hypothetical protein